MASHSDASAAAGLDQRVRLRRLLPEGPPTTVAELVKELGLWERGRTAGGRPHVLLNMISTLDGRATVHGRSGTLSDQADRELFHGLRAAVDAVLVGAGTVRVERYGRLIPDEAVRRLRLERGLAEEPLACIVSGRLTLEPDIPLLREPEARIVIVTSSAASLPEPVQHVEYVRAAHEGRLDLEAALAELHRRLGVETLLCEGGPHLAAQLVAAGLLDELFLSLSPMLAGGGATNADDLRILAGPELEPPADLQLSGALECGSSLFLRYGVSA
jgi:riboflavin-specific deaminase-like protein